MAAAAATVAPPTPAAAAAAVVVAAIAAVAAVRLKNREQLVGEDLLLVLLASVAVLLLIFLARWARSGASVVVSSGGEQAVPSAVPASVPPEVVLSEASSTVAAVPVQPPPLTTPVQELLTVIITTSPIQSHPSSKLLEDVLDSFAHIPGLDCCRKLLVCDGYKVIRETAGRGGNGTNNQSKKGLVSAEVGRRYDEYVEAMTQRAEAGEYPFDCYSAAAGTTSVIRLKKHMGFAYAVKEALTHISTAYVMVVQHDFAFLRPFDLQRVLSAMVAQPDVLKCGQHHPVTQSPTHPLVCLAVQLAAWLAACLPWIQIVALLVLSVAWRALAGWSIHACRYVGLRSSATGGSYGADEARRLGLTPTDVAAVASATLPSAAQARFGAGVPPLVPLLFFYDKTHICLAEHYRKFVLSYRNSGVHTLFAPVL
jgi:hypothetical protein